MKNEPNPLLLPLILTSIIALCLLFMLVFSYQLPRIIQEKYTDEIIRRSTNTNQVIIEK